MDKILTSLAEFASTLSYRDLPATSYYRTQGKDAYERVRPTYIADHLEKGQTALTNHRCADASEEAARRRERRG